MRNTIIQNHVMVTTMAALAMLVLLLTIMPIRPQMWIYPLVRQVMKEKVNYETRNMVLYETEHFKIKYTLADADTVDMIAKVAEAAYLPVTQELNYAPQGKTLILVQPNKNELRKAFGWSGNESAMGVYWGGVIQLLSPHAWMNGKASVDEFIHAGPMIHEYTHLVFDYLTSGNYPRWFTEGLAQYVEYRVNDYQWQTATNGLDGKLYTMAEMNGDFDTLPDQSLAYRQSLAAVRYIAEVYGDQTLQEIIQDLQAGQSMEKAIKSTIGLDTATFEKAWQIWAISHMKHDSNEH